MENGNQQSQMSGKGAVLMSGESLDRRVLEKVILALEARLTEHVSGVERRLAEMDAQIGLELQGVDRQSTGRDSALEEALRQVDNQLREQVEAARQNNAGLIAGVDGRLSTLQDALPARFREIVEAVRESMGARLELAATEIENRVAARAAEDRDAQALPMKQAVEQLESKLEMLREELPPKIREIVEAVESAMERRITAAQQEAIGQASAIRESVEEDLRRQAATVDGLDRKLSAFQQELPARFKAIVDAVQESLEARMAAGRETELERARQESSAIEARFTGLERTLLRSFEETTEEAAGRVWGAIKDRLEQQAGAVAPAAKDSGSITELRQKSTSAEQNVLDLIAGIGDLFERPARPRPQTPEPAANAPEAPAQRIEPDKTAPPQQAYAPREEVGAEEVPVALFRLKEPPRKWRLPFVSTLFLV